MQRTPLIVANWKMHKTAEEARSFIEGLTLKIAGAERQVFIAAPFTAIAAASSAAKETRIQIGAQNMNDHKEGAFTGEISARMLKACGATFVLLGHSERRRYFSETNYFIHQKLVLALQEELTPILCIGELPHERERGEQHMILRGQLEECLHSLSKEQMVRVVIAYEPVWAIGTGKTATPEMAQEMHRFIRDFLEEVFGLEASLHVCLLYGGSVNPDNISALMQQTDIDGVLVGGAALEVRSFAHIVNYQ